MERILHFGRNSMYSYFPFEIFLDFMEIESLKFGKQLESFKEKNTLQFAKSLLSPLGIHV